MDRRIVLTKTAKGLMEVSGKTTRLSRELRQILAQIDGKANVGELQMRFNRLPDGRVLTSLAKLLSEGFVREFLTEPTAPATELTQLPGGELHDLDFTSDSDASSAPGKVHDEADDIARLIKQNMHKVGSNDKTRAAEAEAKRVQEEAVAKAKREAEVRAKAEQEARARAEQQAKLKAAEEARQKATAAEEARQKAAAAEEARQKAAAAEEARQKAAAAEEARQKAAAAEEARQKAAAAEEARQKAAAEEASRKAEARRKAEAIVLAKKNAEAAARRQADEEAVRQAEEEVRREAEEQARRKAEELERVRLEAEQRAQREQEAKRRAEEEARKRQAEEERRKAEEESRKKAEAEARRNAEEVEKIRAEVEARARKEEAARKQAEDDARRNAAEIERMRAEAEERIRREEAARRQAEEEARRKDAELERLRAEAEARAQRESAARREAEEEARRKAEELDRLRREAEEQARQAAAEVERLRAERAEFARKEEESRKRAEEEARQRAEDAARKAREAEDAARKAREAQDAARKVREAEDAARKAREAEDAARKAREAEDAARKAREAEDAARKAREAEARRKAEETEARRKAEEAQASSKAEPADSPHAPATGKSRRGNIRSRAQAAAQAAAQARFDREFAEEQQRFEALVREQDQKTAGEDQKQQNIGSQSQAPAVPARTSGRSKEPLDKPEPGEGQVTLLGEEEIRAFEDEPDIALSPPHLDAALEPAPSRPPLAHSGQPSKGSQPSLGSHSSAPAASRDGIDAKQTAGGPGSIPVATSEIPELSFELLSPSQSLSVPVSSSGTPSAAGAPSAEPFPPSLVSGAGSNPAASRPPTSPPRTSPPRTSPPRTSPPRTSPPRTSPPPTSRPLVSADLEREKLLARERAEAAAVARRFEREREHEKEGVAGEVVEEPVAVETQLPERAPPVVRLRGKRRGLGWWLVGVLLVLAAGGIYASTLYVQIDIPFYEKEASRYLDQPVHIGSANLTYTPLPAIAFSNITIGSGAEFSIVSAVAALDSDMFGASDRRFKTLELDGVTFPAERVLQGVFGAAQRADVGFQRISASNVRVVTTVAKLPLFNVKAEVSRDRRITKLEARDAANTTYISLNPAGEGRMTVEIQSASFAVPFGAAFSLRDFGARGELSHTGLTLSSLDARLFGGVIKGTAQLNFSGPWTLSGKLEAKVLELADAAPAIFSNGRVNGEGAFSMSSANAKDLFGAPALQGKFTVTPSTLKLVDLPQSLENRGEIAVGSTSLDSTGGDIQLSGTQVRLKNILITAGQITGLGNFELDTSRRTLGGRLAIEAPGVDGPRRSGFAFSGTVDRPLLKRAN